MTNRIVVINAAITDPRSGVAPSHELAREILLRELGAPSGTLTQLVAGSHGPTLVASSRAGAAAVLPRIRGIAEALSQDSIAVAIVDGRRIRCGGIFGANRAGLSFDPAWFLLPWGLVARRT